METAGRVDVHFCESIALVEDEPTFSPARAAFPFSPLVLPASSMVVGLKMVRFGVSSGCTVGAGRPPCLFAQDPAVAFISLL